MTNHPQRGERIMDNRNALGGMFDTAVSAYDKTRPGMSITEEIALVIDIPGRVYF